jgi:hypothetical protein
MTKNKAVTRGERLRSQIANLTRFIAKHPDLRTPVTKKVELEGLLRTMPQEVQDELIPKAELRKEEAELRAIAKEFVADTRKAVELKRGELRKAHRDLAEVKRWYLRRFGRNGK